jgi:hypothetical protein
MTAEPQGINDPTTIDMVALSDDDQRIELIMGQLGNWDGSDALLLRLQEKWQNYVGFVVYGGLRKAYPDYADLPWRIVLECRSDPDVRTREFVRLANEATRKEGGDFIIRRLKTH